MLLLLIHIFIPLKLASGSRFILQELLQPKFYKIWTAPLNHWSLETSDKILSLLQPQARAVDTGSKYYLRE